MQDIAPLSLALSAQAQGRLLEAMAAFRDVLASDPGNAVAHYSLAAILSGQGDHAGALVHANAAIAAASGFAPSWLARSIIFTQLAQLQAAVADARAALLIDPATENLLSHWINLRINAPALFAPAPPLADLFDSAEALAQQDQIAAAIAVYRDALATCDPAHLHLVIFNISVLYGKCNLPREAERHLLAAIDIAPAFFEAHLSLGVVLEGEGRAQDALARWRLALTNPAIDLASHREIKLRFLNNIGRLEERERNYLAAEEALHASLAIDPHQAPVLHHWIHLRQKQCSWPLVEPIGLDMETVLAHASPLAMLGLTDDPAEQRRSSERFVAQKVGRFERMVPRSRRYGHDRIRIGYLSSDLSMHAVSLLTVELFESHDRARVETYAFCWSREDGTAFRERVRAGFDHFHKIGHLDDAAAAELIRSCEIDILVDLQGLTGNARCDIVARGPAPVQIGWLGFPGTSALPHVDYVIADRFIFPESLRADFTEEPLFIDAGFQVSDSQRIFGPRPERAALGLPDDAFVFCAFNNSYKITPAMFECWLRILRATPRSILWLLEDNPWARSHLLEFAQRAGVDSHRLHFASRIDPKDYLARFQVADLFLDTTPYNAGTTANDALWAGLPLLTLSGRTYVSRMAGSLLTTAGLPHLVCETFAEYEAKAIQLYERPWEVAEASAHLRRLKGEGLLFDTKRFCREFEQRLVDLLSAPAPV